MGNIVDYVKASTQSFAQRPLNRVDSLVLSWLAYMRIPEEVPESCTTEGISIARLGNQFDVLGLVAPLHDAKQSEELLRACAISPRFAQIVACRSVDTWSRAGEVQFSAITFVLPAEPGGETPGAYVAFRGTDDTLVGWKENFNMAFCDAVPSQTAATEYLDQVALLVNGPLWVGGHSKGGNLAAYALNTCSASARERIVRCFAHDAPGFTSQTMASAAWAGADDLLDKTVPEESIIGLLFNSQAQDMIVVKSTSPGILQHAPFSWVVEGTEFATAHAVSYDSYRTNKRLNAWIATLDTPSRERFVDVLYKLVQSSGEVTFTGLMGTLDDGSLDLMLRRLDGLPDADRNFFIDEVKDLVATMLIGPAPTNPQTPTERADHASSKLDDATARFNDSMSKMDKYLGL